MKRSFHLGLALALVSCSWAQTALDEASNSPYTVGEEYIQVGTPKGDQTAATNGMNGGFGFERWQRGGYGTPPDNGTTLVTNVAPSFNMGTQQWGMRSGPNGVEGADARRRMVNDLPIGGTLSFSMMVGGGRAGQEITTGFYGVEIRSSLLGNPGRDMISINGAPGGNWSVYGLDGRVESTIPITPGQRLDVAITGLGGDIYQIDLTPFGGSTQTYTRMSISAGALIRAAQFYVFNTDGDFYINYLRATSNPAQDYVAPNNFTVGLGRRDSGDLTSLGATDTRALTVCKFLVPNQLIPPVNVQVDGKSRHSTASAITVELVSKMASAGLFSVTLDVFNWTTNDWDATNTVTTNVNTTYSQTTLNLSGNMADYLKPDGSVRARYRVKQTGPAASLNWCHDADRVTWLVTP